MLGHLSFFSSFFPLPAPKETQGKDEGNQVWWVNGNKAEDLWCWRDLEGKGDAGKVAAPWEDAPRKSHPIGN